jgi:hypothetical protein
MGFNFYTFVHFSEQGRAREYQYGGVATCGTPEALVAIATSVSSFRTTASATTAAPSNNKINIKNGGRAR